MKEATFNTELLRSFREYGAWTFKIPDSPITPGVTRVTRFTVAKPFDNIICYKGRFIAVECKQFRKWKSLSIKDFRPAQIVGLDGIHKANGNAFVFLNIRIKADRTKAIKHEDRLLIYEWSTLKYYLENFGNIKAETLKHKEFTPTVVLRKKKYYYIQMDKLIE